MSGTIESRVVIPTGSSGVIGPSGGGTGTSTVFTQNSIVFAGSSGIYSQDNAAFSWNDSTKVLTVTGSALFSGTASKVTLGGTSSTAVHQVNGGINYQVHTVSTTYSVDNTVTDWVILTDSTSAAFTITLPAPTAGRVLRFMDSTGQWATNNVTLAQHSSEKIAGLAASYLLQSPWGSVFVVSNGTDWFLG